MNGYLLIKFFYQEMEQSSDMSLRCGAYHISIFTWLVELQNRVGWERKVLDLPSDRAMTMTGIGSYHTYIKCLNELCTWGMVKQMRASKNQHSARKISLFTAKWGIYESNIELKSESKNEKKLSLKKGICFGKNAEALPIQSQDDADTDAVNKTIEIKKQKKCLNEREDALALKTPNNNFFKKMNLENEDQERRDDRRENGTSTPSDEHRQTEKEKSGGKKEKEAKPEFDSETRPVAKSKKSPSSDIETEYREGEKQTSDIPMAETEPKAKKITTQPPDVEMVRNYFVQERFDKSEAIKFYHYYQALGWKIAGKYPVHDWKSLAVSWMSKVSQFEAKPAINNFRKTNISAMNHSKTSSSLGYHEPL